MKKRNSKVLVSGLISACVLACMPVAGMMSASAAEDIVYGEKVRKIGKIWANEALAGCSDCPIKTYCGADPVRNHSTQGDMYGFRPSSFVCKKNKAIIEYIISLIMERGDEVLPIFRSWLR